MLLMTVMLLRKRIDTELFSIINSSCCKCLSTSSSNSREVRVRFAPSPTGTIHIGGLRTAMYNYFFAKANGGKFLLRIEDTDQSRLVTGAADSLQNILQWANIPPDESPSAGGPVGPYVQSQRLHLYKEHVATLVSSGAAYRCFCSDTRLELLKKDMLRRREIPRYDNRCRSMSSEKADAMESEGKTFCIRFKLVPLTESYNDLVMGSQRFNCSEEGDPVILKGDGFPTYHLASVVDDHLMHISHVLRGAEWLVSTPKHLLLYKAFGWTPPLFAHLPLILNKDGTKLSKRNNDLNMESLINGSYSPEGIFNFLSDIGGGFRQKQHNRVYEVSELIEMFQLSHLSTTPCHLDLQKLDFFNQLELQRCMKHEDHREILVTQLREIVQKSFSTGFSSGQLNMRVLDTNYLTQVLLWAQTRVVKLNDLLSPEFSFVWTLPDRIPVERLPNLTLGNVEMLSDLIDGFTNLKNDVDVTVFSGLVRELASRRGEKVGLVMKLIRLVMSQQETGPSIGEIMSILGRDETIRRLRHAHELLSHETVS